VYIECTAYFEKLKKKKLKTIWWKNTNNKLPL
jgi:hypothetical protein